MRSNWPTLQASAGQSSPAIADTLSACTRHLLTTAASAQLPTTRIDGQANRIDQALAGHSTPVGLNGRGFNYILDKVEPARDRPGQHGAEPAELVAKKVLHQRTVRSCVAGHFADLDRHVARTRTGDRRANRVSYSTSVELRQLFFSLSYEQVPKSNC